ncbi:MAG: hypothetical protein NTZ90_00660 [Proteobacteria bacterium]|nr:hypothetical protein [Pseudomonadota bacterium]
MSSIFKNKLFKYAAALCILQQVFVGLSTFIIGSAGASLADPKRVLLLLGAFFGSSATAYVVGTSYQWLAARLANDLWKKYALGLLDELGRDMGYASPANRNLTNTWLTGEAQSTLEHAANFSLDFLSISCNVVFTLVAFLAILGPLITAAIVVALISSFCLLVAARRAIKSAGNEIQGSKLAAFMSVQSLWDQIFFGNGMTRAVPVQKNETLMLSYFKQAERYRLLEQGVSCLPIFLSMAVLYVAVAHQINHGAIVLAALVAVLPRSLQLFQNVHTMTTYSSQFLLLKAKLSNLKAFSSRLDRRHMGQHVQKDKISILEVTSETIISIDDLLAQVAAKSLQKTGRLRLTGSNGAGKSSFLRDIKALIPQAVLVGPDIHLLPVETKGSTGQIQKQTLMALMKLDVEVLLVDEWDANLDQVNMDHVDQQLQSFAESALVIEVRHSRQAQTSAHQAKLLAQ